MAKIFDKVSQGFLDAIKGVLESTEAYGKSVDKMKDDEKKKNISASDTDKISKLAAMMKAEKKPVKEAKGDITVKSKSSADAFAQHTGQDKKKISVPKDPKTGKTLFQKVTSEEAELEESTYDKMMTAKKAWATYPTASNEKAYKAAKELHKKTRDAMKEEAEQVDEKLSDDAKKVIKTTVDKTGAKVRPLVKLAMMAKDKGKPMGEAMDLPWKEDPKNPSHKVGTHKDKYGNVIKNVAKHLAKKAMKANEEVEQIDEYGLVIPRRDNLVSLKKHSFDNDFEDEMKKTRQTKKSVEDAKKKYGVKKEETEIEEAYGMWKVEFPKQHAGKDVAAGSVHVKAQNTAHAHKVAAKRVGVDHKVFKSKVTKSSILPEEAEDLDEVSKATLGRYVNKAKDQIDAAAWRSGYRSGKPNDPSSDAVIKAKEKQLSKRHGGIEMAVKKLTKEEAIDESDEGWYTHHQMYNKISKENWKKGWRYNQHKPKPFYHQPTGKWHASIKEEVERLDELSPKTLGSYVKKASRNITTQGITAGLKMKDDEDTKKQFHKIGNRERGIAKAVSKLAKEDQDFIDSINDMMFDEIAIAEARGRPKKAAAKDYTIHPKTKEKLMHNNPEHMKKIELLQKNGILPKPKTEASQHIMNQLQKAKTSMTGGSVIHFTHGESKHVSGTHAAKLLDKYASLRPNEKEDFQKKIGHSHEQLMKHV